MSICHAVSSPDSLPRQRSKLLRRESHKWRDTRLPLPQSVELQNLHIVIFMKTSGNENPGNKIQDIHVKTILFRFPLTFLLP